jgi:putative ABC transport system permease protein
MTQRAVPAVIVDWQVQLVAGADAQTVADAAGEAAPVRKAEWVEFADVESLEATAGGTVQATGAGKVLGISSSYFEAFPGQARLLSGSLDGVLVAQQTAANLHVGAGDSVIIKRAAGKDATVRIAGIVDLPNADQLFQTVGVPPNAAPQAPPDNVMLLPQGEWHQTFDAQAAARPDTIRRQLHLKLDHAALPQDPAAAYVEAGDQGRNFEARAVGTALLANNLAARLGAVREDALYARVLFLFLGAPGVIMAMLLTLIVAASGATRKRHDEALLRVRGASLQQLVRLSAAEALAVGISGAAAGIMLAEVSARALLKTSVLTFSGLPWLSAAAALGVALSMAAILVPALRRARRSTVMAASRTIERQQPPLWARAHVDLLLLVLAAVIFWRSASAGYQVVLAPEGVAATSVDYTAFLAPLILWIGLGLLTVRLATLAFSRGRALISSELVPFTGQLAAMVAATLARQSRRLTVGLALTALAFAFAASTAAFNATYEAQAKVDAELTNGADVTVAGTSAAPAGNVLAALRKLPGVVAAEPMQHRNAYVGSDLQDLYGIDPMTIGHATSLSDAYFANGSAAATLAALARTPDGVLVSEETVTDYQLQPGDRISLRLQSAADHQYHVVPFRFIGVVREFPTAPRDSFLVANAAYVAEETGTPSSEDVLIRAAGDPAAVAAAAGHAVAALSGVKVTDLNEAERSIGSSLTAINVAGLTRLELAFALVVVAAAAGLVLSLGLADRQRSFVILTALGAKRRQLGAFVWSEATLVFVGGTVLGLATGMAVAYVLVKLLTGVFDPPPETLAVPWLYLAALIAVAALAAALAALGAVWTAQIRVTEKLRGEP